MILEELVGYAVEEAVGVTMYNRPVAPPAEGYMKMDIRTVGDLWENKFVFKYDPSLKEENRFDDIEFYEKNQDELKNF